MKLLENELIQKYFGCNECRDHIRISESADRHTSQRILQAMAEPVKVDELYLAISDQGIPSGPHTFTSSDVWKFHCQWLRLPDQFQPKRELISCPNCGTVFGKAKMAKKPDPCTHNYGVMGVGCMPWCKERPDAVGAKIKEITIALGWCDSRDRLLNQPLKAYLDELVELARKQ